MSGRDPEVFIQWKGTDACVDLHCACGSDLHYDGDFAYELTCGVCHRVWELPSTLPLKDVTDCPRMPPNVLTPSGSEPGRTAEATDRAPLNTTEKAVWAAWNALGDDDPSPVKRIARQLGMEPADVAFIVFPAETFGRWEDDHEPDI